MKKLMHTILPLILLVFITNAYSRTITVGHDAGYDYQTITAALEAAESGDTVIVEEGTYSQSSGEIFPLELKSGVTLKRATTDTLPLILGNNSDTVIYSEAEDALIEGLAIEEGRAPVRIEGRDGGGLYIASGNLEVKDCRIYGNHAFGGGGGVFCATGSRARFVRCYIANNEGSERGGGICCSTGSQVEILNCRIERNYASLGGGIYSENCPTTVRCCAIVFNRGASGVGIYCKGEPNAQIHNCIISGNVSVNNTAGGIRTTQFSSITNCVITGNHEQGIYFDYPSFSTPNPPVWNCIIWNNGRMELGGMSDNKEPDINYCCIKGGWAGGTGNISEDPLFERDGYWDGDDPRYSYWTEGDYTLLDGSPCIDAGKPGAYYYDACLPPGKGSERNDMGAYGGPYNCDAPDVGYDYQSIQAAIDAAADGDEIIVSPGTYYENIRFNGKNVILRSTDPTSPTVVASTILDGNQSGSVIVFSGSELPSCIISGFTITNGNGFNGGAVEGNTTYATIQNNIISGNTSAYTCAIGGLNGTIQNNLIINNSGHQVIGGCDGTIQNNIIAHNDANGFFACYSFILNNTIYGNSGFGFYNGDGFICNCIIWGNGDGQLYGSSTPLYSCIQDWAGGGNSNISADPRFADPSNNDFHLLPDSPCINAGYAFYLAQEYAADIDGECRLAGGAVDIGADEHNSPLDKDGDLLSDSDETAHGTSIANFDTDADGLSDGAEILRGTNPLVYNTPTAINIPADFPSIQQGIFLAIPSEEIRVSEGSYNENLYFMGKNLTLTSTNPLDPSVVNNTIIDGGGASRVVLFKGTENETCAVRGLTLRNGHSSWNGGGIYGHNTEAIIEYNNIADNIAGGIANCNGIIQNNIISGNSANRGGGLSNCHGIIRNNTISGNLGSGLYNCDGTIHNNIISYNTGGGLNRCNSIITNNTISFNSTTTSGGGIYGCYYGVIENNVISYNSADGYGGGIYGADFEVNIKDNLIIGNSALHNGGGLEFCWGTISNNVISHNSAKENGGGFEWCNGTIEQNVISGNMAGANGGGLSECNGTIKNNIISANSAAQCGGGIYASHGAIIQNNIYGNSAGYSGGGLSWCSGIYNCIITGNSANDEGGGLYSPYDVPIYNCTISDNYAKNEGGGIFYYQVIPTPTPPWPLPWAADNETESQSEGSYLGENSIHLHGETSQREPNIQQRLTIDSLDIKNSIIWNNFNGEISYNYIGPSARYCCIKGGWSQWSGNISDDPLFVDPGYWTGTPGSSTWVNGNYQLAPDSPCIDAGDPDPQWNDACLPPGQGTQRNDMGAYGGPYNCGWGEPTAPPVCFDFNNGPQGWNFAGRIASFNGPNSTWDTGRLGLSPAGSANCFSYWCSPVVYARQDKPYRVRWTVSSSVSNADEALDFRLRANQLGDWRFWTTSVISLNDAAPTTQTKTYDLIILPEMESPIDSIFLSFDLMGFDPANDSQSWLYLDEVRMDEVSITPIVPTVILAHHTFDNDSEGWEFQGKIADFDEPLPVVEPGQIGLSPNSSPYCFSYWLSPEIEVGKDRVYLVSWQVSSSTSDPDQVVDFRLRCNQTSNLRAWDTGTLFSLGAAYPAEGEPRTYELMIFPQMSTESDTVRLSFDIVSFDGSNDLDSSIYLEDVTVQEYLIQP